MAVPAIRTQTEIALPVRTTRRIRPGRSNTVTFPGTARVSTSGKKLIPAPPALPAEIPKERLQIPHKERQTGQEAEQMPAPHLIERAAKQLLPARNIQTIPKNSKNTKQNRRRIAMMLHVAALANNKPPAKDRAPERSRALAKREKL